MLSELSRSGKVIGVKQTKRAISSGSAERVFVAADADRRLTGPIIEACKQSNIPYTEIESMRELGRACGIGVGAAVAAIISK